MIFFPYAPTINLINHDSQEPNVRLRWSHSNLHYGKHMLEKSVDDVWATPSGLLMEYVALRDVEEGEEILLDYGSDWQEAWERHVASWTAPTQEHVYPVEFDIAQEEVRTIKEVAIDPYPSHLRTTCHYLFDPRNPAKQWEAERGVNELENLYPCKVLRRYPGNIYTVEIQNKEDVASRANPTIPPGHIVTHVPRAAIRFSNKLYASDQHLGNAFRQPIGIPDDIFPRGWMDIAA